MQKVLCSLGVSVILSVMVLSKQATNVYAGCVPVYGGGVECPRAGNSLIDKKVLNPFTGIFVDNLGPNDPKILTQRVVTFRIIVRNANDQVLKTVVVTDKLPLYVDFVSGPGTYDHSSRTLTFTVNDLAGNATKSFDIITRVVHPALLPQNQNVVCSLVNTAEVEADGQRDRDESSFCVQKDQRIKVVPKAGPEDWILAVLATTLVAGFLLKKKAYLG